MTLQSRVGFSLRTIKIACKGYSCRRVMGFSQAKSVLPTSNFFTCSHVQNVVVTEGSKCEVGLGSSTKKIGSNFRVDRSYV